MSTTTASPEGSSLSSDPDVTRGVEQNDAGTLGINRHTRGPWTAEPWIWTGGPIQKDEGEHAGCFKVTDAAENVVCSRNPWPEMAEEMRANARLIASAPELLAALKALADAVHEGRLVADCEGSEGYIGSVVESAETAIAKAMGAAS